MSKSTLKTLPALMVAITVALLTQPVFGQNHQMVITENSSTSLLTVTYDGLTAGITQQNLGADLWTITFPQDLFLPTGLGSTLSWFEPGNPNQINVLSQAG